jgi:DNA polymerase III subunit beta
MTFKLSQSDFYQGLKRIAGACSNNFLPILSGVLIRPIDGQLELVTSNLDYEIATRISGQCSGENGAVLPFRKIFQLTGELNSEIEINIGDKHAVTIRCGARVASLSGFEPNDFPRLKVDAQSGFSVPQKALAEMIGRVIHAVSADATRFVLNGVLVRAKGGRLEVVATDGKRLARATRDSVDGKCEFVLPTKSASELLRILSGDSDSDVKVEVESASVSFCTGDTTMVSKVIDAAYPNFHQSIPRESDGRVQISREALLSTLRCHSVFADEARFQRVDLEFTRNALKVSSQSKGNNGAFSDEIPINYKGSMKSVFNSLYLSQPLSALDCDDVTLEFTDELSPMVIKADGFTGVMMPLRA